MTLERRIIASLVLGLLGFISTLSASLVVATNNSGSLIGIGVVLLIFGVVRIFRAIRIKDDPKRRWVAVWVAAFCVLGGIVLFFEDDELREISHPLTIVVLFAFTAIAVSTLVSSFYPRITACAIPQVLADAKVTQSEERLVYFVAHMFSGLLVGVLVGISDPENKVQYLDTHGLTNSIGIWFLNGVLLALLGLLWAWKSAPNAGAYVSSATPLSPETSSYVNDMNEVT
jgi:uncharacterized membrane protein HdeD (DUF308 family)